MSRPSAEEEIREVVFRKEMLDWIHSADKAEAEAKTKSQKTAAPSLDFKVFLVSVDGKDPSDTLIKRLADIPRALKKTSSSSSSKEWPMAVLDKGTGQRAITFRVGKIHWLSETSAEVDGGYHCGALCGIGITFTVNLLDGKWTLVKQQAKWIS